MLMAYISLLVLVVAVVLLFSLLLRIFRKPIKIAAKLFINALFGFLALFLINFFGDPLGIALGINWINAIVIGILGVPGAVVLIFINLFL